MVSLATTGTSFTDVTVLFTVVKAEAAMPSLIGR